MQEFTGTEYVMIDIANQFGLDRENWSERLAWVNKNTYQLEALMDEAKHPLLYIKAVYALRDAELGIPSGHLIGLDATASGPQLLACLTGCIQTGALTNLVFSGRRVDLYGEMADIMGLGLTRDIIKNPLMVTFYNSIAEPKKIFGDGTPEYIRFMETIQKELPGAVEAMEAINAFWDDSVSAQHWIQLDNMNCHVNVKTQCKAVIEADEIGSSFTYVWDEVGPSSNGISLPANMTQSFDALVVREMKRRCNYDLPRVQTVYNAAKAELTKRLPNNYGRPLEPEMICMNHITGMELTSLQRMSPFDLGRIVLRLEKMLKHKPFPIVTIHDEFKAHPNNMNVVRYNYKEILAEIAECPALSNVLGTMQPCNHYEKLSHDLPRAIRDSEYALS